MLTPSKKSELFSKVNIAVTTRPNLRNISLKVTPEGHLLVTAPKYTTHRVIEKTIREYEPWIRDTLKKMEDKPQFHRYITYESGDAFLYFGKPITLQVLTGQKKNEVALQGKLLKAKFKKETATPFEVKTAVVNWYKAQAKDIILDRIETLLPDHFPSPNQIRIKTLQSRWGSCSSKRNLNFNWALLMAPLRIIDYVVLHELCHLVHHDHSKRFWSEVAKWMPDYEKCIEWLNHHQLSLRLP